MIPLSTRGGHSARVNMRLLVDGLSLPVAQMGPDFIFVDSPANLPPASARMVLQVDESERSWLVRLPNGIFVGRNRVQLATVE
jgi:hypothetical protein